MSRNKIVVIILLFCAFSGGYYFWHSKLNESKLSNKTGVGRYENLYMGIAFQIPETVTVAAATSTGDIFAIKDKNHQEDTMHAFSVTLYPELKAIDLVSLRSIVEKEVIPNAYTQLGKQVSVEDVQIAESRLHSTPVLTFRWEGSEGIFLLNSRNQVIVIDMPYYLDPPRDNSSPNKLKNTYSILETLEVL